MRRRGDRPPYRSPSLVRDTAGAVLVEFALTALVFFALAFGTIEVGRLYWISQTLQLAASSAARYASLHGSNSDSPATNDAVRDAARSGAPGLVTSQISVATNWDPDNAPGSTVTVRVQYPFNSLVANLVPFGNITLSGTASTVVIN